MAALIAEAEAGPSYLTSEHTIASWLLIKDHKRIALLFFASVTFFFFVGGFAATMIRLQLATPNSTLLQPSLYNRMFTMHGVVMVWFFLIPSTPTTLGNFLVPLMIGGAPDDRDRFGDGDGGAGLAPRLLTGLLPSGRSRGALLALRRFRVGLPLSPHLSQRPGWQLMTKPPN